MPGGGHLIVTVRGRGFVFEGAGGVVALRGGIFEAWLPAPQMRRLRF